MTLHTTPPPCPPRHRLPDTRMSTTHKFVIAGVDGFFTLGRYPGGEPGELFITMDHEGSNARGAYYVVGTLISILLQHGIPPTTIANKLEYMRYEPAGMTENPAIPIAQSIADYLGKWLRIQATAQPAQRKEACPTNAQEQHAAEHITKPKKETENAMHEPTHYTLSPDGSTLLAQCAGGPNNVPVPSGQEANAMAHQLHELLRAERARKTAATYTPDKPADALARLRTGLRAVADCAMQAVAESPEAVTDTDLCEAESIVQAMMLAPNTEPESAEGLRMLLQRALRLAWIAVRQQIKPPAEELRQLRDVLAVLEEAVDVARTSEARNDNPEPAPDTAMGSASAEPDASAPEIVPDNLDALDRAGLYAVIDAEELDIDTEDVPDALTDDTLRAMIRHERSLRGGSLPGTPNEATDA